MATEKEAVIEALDQLIDTLTFKRLALITGLIITGISMFVFFENRGVIFTKVLKNTVEAELIVPQWELSDISKDALIYLVNNTKIVALSIIDVDLKKNRRAVKYRYIKDEILKKEVQLKTGGTVLPLALFDSDAKNTQQMIAILNNEFKCSNTEDTIYKRIYPSSFNAGTICRIAIPPFVGQFAGYMSVGLQKDITSAEIDSIRLEVSRLAVEIYHRDVIKK